MMCIHGRLRGLLLPAILPVLMAGASVTGRAQEAPPAQGGEALGPDESRPARATRGAVPRGIPGLRLVVNIEERTLAALRGSDTIFFAPVGVATGMTLEYAGRSWRFETPRGGRRVLRKLADPVWTPPDWHYAEVAREHKLRLAQIPAGGVRLRNGYRLVVRNGDVGVVLPGRGFSRLPLEEHVVFDDRLYVPPLGSRNRKITRELGDYALDLGGGYLIHGTPDESSVGQASTHGCIRMRDADIAWIYENVPVGAPVTIR